MKINFNDFRKSTNQERNIINEFIALKRKDSIKLLKTLVYIFTPLTLLMLIGTFINFNLFIMFLTVLFLILLVYFLNSYLKTKKKIKLVDEVDIIVLDCEIYNIETNIDTPGCWNVKIKDKNGREYNEYFKVRQENVEIGSRCLLVCKKHPTDVKKDSFVVFTDFMLSDKGLKLRNRGYDL